MLEGERSHINHVLTYEEIIQMPDVKAAKTLGEQDVLILSRYRESRDRVEGERRKAYIESLGVKPNRVNP